MDELRDKLANELDTVDWRALRAHLHRDQLIVVDPELELLEVACCVARDRSAEVAAWIAAGQLCKPGPEQLNDWERQLDKPFRLLIVAPYLLVQAA